MENPASQMHLHTLLNVSALLLNSGGKNWGIGLILFFGLSSCLSAGQFPLDSEINLGSWQNGLRSFAECLDAVSIAKFIWYSFWFLGGLLHLIITVFCKHFNQLLIFVSSFTLDNWIKIFLSVHSKPMILMKELCEMSLFWELFYVFYFTSTYLLSSWCTIPQFWNNIIGESLLT